MSTIIVTLFLQHVFVVIRVLLVVLTHVQVHVKEDVVGYARHLVEQRAMWEA